jgi:hypothetical protein
MYNVGVDIGVWLIYTLVLRYTWVGGQVVATAERTISLVHLSPQRELQGSCVFCWEAARHQGRSFPIAALFVTGDAPSPGRAKCVCSTVYMLAASEFDILWTGGAVGDPFSVRWHCLSSVHTNHHPTIVDE